MTIRCSSLATATWFIHHAADHVSREPKHLFHLINVDDQLKSMVIDFRIAESEDIVEQDRLSQNIWTDV